MKWKLLHKIYDTELMFNLSSVVHIKNTVETEFPLISNLLKEYYYFKDDSILDRIDSKILVLFDSTHSLIWFRNIGVFGYYAKKKIDKIRLFEYNPMIIFVLERIANDIDSGTWFPVESILEDFPLTRFKEDKA